MAGMNTVLEGSLKYREGKKWKSRWCVIKKLSPVADRLHISLYKNVKDYNKKAREKNMLSLEEFCGIEAGFVLDKEQNVLAIICEKQTIVLAFASKEILQTWNVKIQSSLGPGQRFPVYLAQVPQSSKLPLGPASMHVHSQRVALTTSLPPKVLMTWNISHLRRFGDITDKFVFEGGSSCGKGAGVFIFLSHYSAQINQVYKDSMDIRPTSKRDAIRRRSQTSMASRNSQNSNSGGQSTPPRYVESPNTAKRQTDAVVKEVVPHCEKQRLPDYDFPPSRASSHCSCSTVSMNNLGKNGLAMKEEKRNQNFSANITPVEKNAHFEDGNSNGLYDFEKLAMPKNAQRCKTKTFIDNVNRKLAGIYPDLNECAPTNDYDTLPKANLSNQMQHQDYDLPKSPSSAFADYHVPTSNRHISDYEEVHYYGDNVSTTVDIVGNKNIHNKTMHSPSQHSNNNNRLPAFSGKDLKSDNIEMVVLRGTNDTRQSTVENTAGYIVGEPAKSLPFVNLDDFDGSADNNHHFVSYGYDNVVSSTGNSPRYDNVSFQRVAHSQTSGNKKTWVDASGYTHLRGESNLAPCTFNNNQNIQVMAIKPCVKEALLSGVDRCDKCGHPSTIRQTPLKCPLVRAPPGNFSRKVSLNKFEDYDVPPRHSDYDVPPSHVDYDRLPPRRYDNYDVPPPFMRHSDYDIPPRPVISESETATSPHNDYHIPPHRIYPKSVEAQAKPRAKSPPITNTQQMDYMVMKVDCSSREQLSCSSLDGTAHGITPQPDYTVMSPVTCATTLPRKSSAAGSYLAMKPGASGASGPSQKTDAKAESAIKRSHSLKNFNCHKPLCKPSLSVDGTSTQTSDKSATQGNSGIVKPFDNLVPHEHHSARKFFVSPRCDSPKLDALEKNPASSNKSSFLSKLRRRNSRDQKQPSPENVPLTHSEDSVKTGVLTPELRDKCSSDGRNDSNSAPPPRPAKPYKVKGHGIGVDVENLQTPLLDKQSECESDNCLNSHSLRDVVSQVDRTRSDSGSDETEEVWMKREGLPTNAKHAIQLSEPPQGKNKNHSNLTVKMPLETVVESKQQDSPSVRSLTPSSSIPPSPLSVYSEGSSSSHKSDEQSRPKSAMSTTMRPRSGKEYQKVDRKKLAESVCIDRNSPLSPVMNSHSSSVASVFTFDTISYLSSKSSRISKVNPDGSVSTPLSLYMNMELSPPSTPNSPISIPEHKLNYAEIDLSGTVSCDSSLLKLPEKDSTTNYAIIDMVATATAGRVGKEHARWREDSLQLKPKA